MLRLNFIPFIVILFFSCKSYSQQDSFEDIVYLKNGNTVVGKIIENIPDKHIKLETRGGSVFTFSSEEVLIIKQGKIMTEISPKPSQQPIREKEVNPKPPKTDIQKTQEKPLETITPKIKQRQVPQETFSLAEAHLGRLSTKMKELRTIDGVGWLAVGTTFLIGGAIVANKDFEGADIIGGSIMGVGVVFGGVGIWRLSSKSRAEDEYDNVQAIANIQQRESSGRAALQALAEDAHSARIYRGIAAALTSFSCFIFRPLKEIDYKNSGSILPDQVLKDSPWNDYCGIAGAVWAVYHFTFPSSEEKALERYEEESGTRFKPRFGLGYHPNYGVQFCMQYIF